MSELLVQDKATNAAEAAEWVRKATLDYAKGGPDLEADSLRLAEQFGLNVDAVRASWADVKARRTELELEQPSSGEAIELQFDPDTPQWFRKRKLQEAAEKRAKAAGQEAPKSKSLLATTGQPHGTEPKAESVAETLAAAATAKVRKLAPSTKPALDRGSGSGFLDRVGGTGGHTAFPDIPDAPLPPANASEIDRLTYPRGLLGHVTQYMVDTSPLPHRWLSLASALCALAKGLDRKVIGPSGTSTVLYILLMAETGAGKQQALQSIRMVLKAMGLGNVIAAGALASVQAIEEIVEQMPSALVVIDEVGAWLNRISAGGQVGNVAEIPGTLQSLWAWSPEDEWIGTKRKGKDMVTVFGPALSIFGDSTEAKLIKGLTKEEIANGFLNRWLLFDVGRGAPSALSQNMNGRSSPLRSKSC
jgi:hypothetical protein